MPVQPLFPEAVRQVEAWLDGDGASYAKRSVRQGAVAAWDLVAVHPALGPASPQLSLPPDFPAHAAELHVDASLCLKLPHVEGDGRVCLNAGPYPDDFDKPAQAVRRLVQRFDEGVLVPSNDAMWTEREFHQERRS